MHQIWELCPFAGLDLHAGMAKRKRKGSDTMIDFHLWENGAQKRKLARAAAVKDRGCEFDCMS
jgi:hypothetical protein